MIVNMVDILIGGLMLGGLFALIALGLNLQYGVARVLNIGHGEFIMVGSFGGWMLFTAYGVNPLISLLIISPVLFGLGYGIYRVLYSRLRKKTRSFAAFEGSSMLVSFGLLFVIQNIALTVWGSSVRGYSYLNSPIRIAGTVFAANRIVTLGVAVLVGLVFYIFSAHTRLGKAIRAAAQDSGAAGLVGVNINQVLPICFGFGAMLAGIAGVLISICYSITPTMGLEYTVIAIIVVVLGGIGSIPGSFIGGFILGIIGSIVNYIQPGLSLAAYYVIFMLLLLLKPKGIFGR